ncbi:protein peste-like [Anopheles albimanus]|uniref:Scavenger receptor class B n=1 Tax=Anopheles albimanus TaxID=7167 RepID=A0A182FIV2_ANOAL|nr:protein peste-like [Anopheles albimanus]XP_035789551.1 protein peste-like [Anopheles albimanus]
MLRCCCRWYMVVGFGLAVAATGLIFLLGWRDIFNTLVVEEKSLAPGTPAYKEWRRPTVRPVWHIELYNWTNAAQFLAAHLAAPEPPHFEPVGPFVYQEHTEPVDVKVHAVSGTIAYRRRTIFRPVDGTADSSTRNVTTVNLALLAVASVARTLSHATQRELSFLLHSLDQTLTVVRPVGELLFTGYREPLVAQVRHLVCDATERPGAMAGWLCAAPSDRTGDRLALFRTFNLTRRPADQQYQLSTGLHDHGSYGLVSGASGPQWQSDGGCSGQFSGYTGELFPARTLDRTQPLVIVLPDLCTSVRLLYDGETEVNGIVGARYRADEMPLVAADACADSQPSNRTGGMLNTYPCGGLPLYSAPYNGTFLVVETVTGIVLESSIGRRYEAVLEPSSRLALLQDVPTVRVPVVEFARHYRVHPVQAARLRDLLGLLDAGHRAALAGTGLGLFIATSAIVYALAVAHRRRHRNGAVGAAQKPPPGNAGEYRVVAMHLGMATDTD